MIGSVLIIFWATFHDFFIFKAWKMWLEQTENRLETKSGRILYPKSKVKYDRT